MTSRRCSRWCGDALRTTLAETLNQPWEEQGRYRWGLGGGRGKRSKRGELAQVGDQHQEQDPDPMGPNANNA
jgi:hypothetical protein